jgi:hypothetical protein
MKLTDANKPWLMQISHKNFETNAALIQCQGKNGYNGDVIAERLWIITRHPSPLGYPTDPIICGGKRGKCEDLKWLFRVECMPDYGPGYRGTVSKTKTGIIQILFIVKNLVITTGTTSHDEIATALKTGAQ